MRSSGDSIFERFGGFPPSPRKAFAQSIRKTLYVFELAVVLVILTAPSASAELRCGDANADGVLTATDALSSLKAAVGVQNCANWYCDTNDDGIVTTIDAFAILLSVVGNEAGLAALDCPDAANTEDESDDRAEVINDPERLAGRVSYDFKRIAIDPATGRAADQDDGRIRIINDAVRLDAKIERGETNIPIDVEAVYGDASAAPELTLDLIAEVPVPAVEGAPLAATAVYRGATDNRFLVAYNVAGAQQSGAIDYFNLQDPTVPVLTSEAIFYDADVHAVTSDGSAVYLATATSDPQFDEPAVIERLTLVGEQLTLQNGRRRALSSHAVTSAVVHESTLYTTTGDSGHVYALDPEDLSVRATALLDDARWVDVEDDTVVVVQGTPGRVATFDTDAFAPLGSFLFDGANVPESKSTVQVVGGKAFVAAGPQGVIVVSVETGTILGTLPVPPPPPGSSIASSDIVTNAVTVSGRLAFVSNGGAGVYAALLDEDPSTTDSETPVAMSYYGKLRFDGIESVNHVWFTGRNLIVAAGRGGVKVISVVGNEDGAPAAPLVDWRADSCDWDVDGGSIKDFSGWGHDAESVDAQPHARGLICRAAGVSIDGSRVVGTASDDGIGEAVTVMAWIRGKGGKVDGDEIPMISLLEDPVTAIAALTYRTNDDALRFEVATEKGLAVTQSLTGLDAERWTHVAAAYDGARVSIYVNGKHEGSSLHGGYFTESDSLTIVLGGAESEGVSIDEFILFNAALSESQVAEIYVNNLGAKSWDGQTRYCEVCEKEAPCGDGCDDENPCTDDLCGDEGCSHVPNTAHCDDGDACTLDDRCSEGACGGSPACGRGESCAPETGTCYIACDSEADCNDGDPCTDDACSEGTCVHSPSPSCQAECSVDTDCDDGDRCTVDLCVAGECSHAEERPCGYECESDAECDDAEHCTIDACMNGECVYAVPAICPPEACSNDLQCDDGEACTEDYCSDGRCVSERIPECGAGCEAATDCDDGNPCTAEECVERTCIVMPIDDCGKDSCETNADCADDDACTSEVCSDAKCVREDLPGCGSCVSDSECDTGKPCEIGRCIAEECMVFPLAFCGAACATDEECADGDPCTVESCEKGGCVIRAADECGGVCETDADCEVVDPCQTGACVEETCVVTTVPGCDE